MTRTTILALTTLALVASASMTGAQAGSYKGGYGKSTSYEKCYWQKKKIFIGYDAYGNARYEWKRVKVCH